ncbi:MAG: SDR family oxidoreductase [Clostridiales bacterium]|nr:SDR family oxidoreductase [Clostridiales bacterium]
MVSREFVENLFSIKGKTAIVTGATGALGSAVAAGYALAGAKVVLTARNEAKLKQIESDLIEAGCDCSHIAGDPGDENDVRKIVAYSVQKYGEVNILCACHGFNAAKSVLDQSVEDWEKIMDANAKSVYILSKCVAEQMVAQGKGGKIVITSSARSKRGMKAYTGYSSSKGAVDLMVQSLGCDLGEHNIQVNSFNPTVFRSDLTEWMFHDDNVYQNFLKRLPIGRLGEPADFIGMAIFLASQASDFFTSSNYAADGGYWGN